MIQKLRASRERKIRNQQKAVTLIAELGSDAENYVDQQVNDSKWSIAAHEHWLRVQKQVQILHKP